MPKATGSGACAPAWARRNTLPDTLTVCVGNAVTPRLLVPLPFDANNSVAVPDFAPALAVSMPTLRLVLLLAPAANRLNEPSFVVALPVNTPKLASSASENPSATAVFASVSTWLALSPTRRLPKLIGSGVCADATAKR